MISSTASSEPLKLKPSERLKLHFLALARQLVDWNQHESGRQAIGVAGCTPKVGASTVAFNLAASLAKICAGEVLLIETDFGNPLVSKQRGKQVSGFSDILSLQSSPEQCILTTSIDGLSVLGCGAVGVAEAMSLSFESLSNFNNELREKFDFVIYDLPTASDMTPCFTIANQLDGTVLVCAADQVDQEKIRRIKKRLSYTSIVGLVLNRAK